MKFKLSLTPLILLEIFFTILFIVVFGLGNFLAFVLISMVCGIVILGIFWKNLLEFHIDSFKNMFIQFSFVISGFLLIFPGILSSILGILIFIFGILLKISTNTNSFKANTKQNSCNDDIIDVEIIEDNK
ncbi:integral memnbrane protein [Campylobacter sp. TTU-622]|uniref:integral memnbrane protein n=1 Tax=unclassified Campylobacter TaxID=2593542 RepID=UPI0019037460|nr:MULTISPECIES: integral memnbrane protein [unclassified Campylobacter]MBK1971726.1 integral memnbrane protein [Campylobacter sp. TTU_617]MBK1972799.1 integral memnbrane protein [Campylobacter sp. TTU-622]MBK1991674.1 integral memnbrane protein [Campylobacter sp. 2018MI34]